MVGYLWRDRWCMRARPRHYHDRQSEAQLVQRSRFKAMIQFASPATSLLRIGLRALAAQRQLTEGNCFLQLNNDAFGSGTVDYARLRFSHGHLPAVRLTEAEVGEGGVVTVQWSKEGGRNEDRVHFYAYSPMCGTGLTVATVERGRRRGRFVLPAQFAGADVHLWAVAENAAGEVSPTAYILLSVDTADVEGGGAPSSQLLNAAEPEAISLSRPNLPEVTVGFGEFPPGEAPH